MTAAGAAAAAARVGRRPALDPSIFLGSWRSTNRDTQGIAAVDIRHVDGRLLVRAFGALTPSPCDWGEVAATVLADGPESQEARAFVARIDLGFKDVALQAKVEKGVLVVANFNRFKDGSGRASFYSREFFYRAPHPGPLPASGEREV